MKYMVSCRQTKEYLRTADEIFIDYKDKPALSHMIEEDWVNPAEMCIYVPVKQEIEWDYFNKYKDILKMKFFCENPQVIPVVKAYGYKAAWAYPITSYWELKGILALGVDEVLIDAPLFFDLPTVKKVCGDVEIRINPIKVDNPYVQHEDTIHGTYVRPEDVDEYEKYVSHMDFGKQELEKERTLVKIYKEAKNWPGNLNILLEGLHYNIDNRGFDENFAKRRLTCRQVCQSEGYCHYCDLMFSTISYIDKNKEELAEFYHIDYSMPKKEEEPKSEEEEQPKDE